MHSLQLRKWVLRQQGSSAECTLKGKLPAARILQSALECKLPDVRRQTSSFLCSVTDGIPLFQLIATNRLALLLNTTSENMIFQVSLLCSSYFLLKLILTSANPSSSITNHALHFLCNYKQLTFQPASQCRKRCCCPGACEVMLLLLFYCQNVCGQR